MMDDNNGHQAVSCQAEGYALSGGGRSIQRVGKCKSIHLVIILFSYC